MPEEERKSLFAQSRRLLSERGKSVEGEEGEDQQYMNALTALYEYHAHIHTTYALYRAHTRKDFLLHIEEE